MLKNMLWVSFADDLDIEVQQSKDEGKYITNFFEKAKRIKEIDPAEDKREQLASELYDEMAKLATIEDYKYYEPSDLESIKEARPVSNKNIRANIQNLSKEEIYNKVYGAWLGRSCGCLLGQPIEGWHRLRIVNLLKNTENYPINYYISSNIPKEIKERYGVVDEKRVYGSNLVNWINNIQYMPEDDDMNYTIIGLKAMEEYGYEFTPKNMAEIWLDNLPVMHVCTAERVAYRNFVRLIAPPQSATYRNPYREWIGAQIRADFFGYTTPGNPELGAELAWRDASISHVKNGIYGEMFIAAMLSTAFTTDNIEKIIKTGLSQIPVESRLSEEVNKILSWKKEGVNWEEAIERVHEKYNEKNPHDWCHTISNAVIVCISLLFGELDFEKSLGIAVSAGFDTDCNGATVGSIIGMILGANELPEKWIKPLNNKIKSGVDGFGLVEISEMAERTVKVIAKANQKDFKF